MLLQNFYGLGSGSGLTRFENSDLDPDKKSSGSATLLYTTHCQRYNVTVKSCRIFKLLAK
jgi:hypothetical protein